VNAQRPEPEASDECRVPSTQNATNCINVLNIDDAYQKMEKIGKNIISEFEDAHPFLLKRWPKHT
jgi:hypothetical protein